MGNGAIGLYGLGLIGQMPLGSNYFLNNTNQTFVKYFGLSVGNDFSVKRLFKLPFILCS